MQKAIYTTVGIDELLSHVQALKGVGARFVQMHAERSVDDGSYRLVYTFINVRAAQKHIAQQIISKVLNAVKEWRALATKLGIAKSDQERFSSVFDRQNLSI